MSPAAPYTIASNSCQRKPPMPLPDRNPKSRCQTPLMSRSQPITIATPMPDASGRVIAKNPQISIRMPQIILPLPVAVVDVESVIRSSSRNHRRQSSSSLASRFHLLPAFCCNASLDVWWRTRALLRLVIVVLSAVLEHKSQAAAAKQRTFFAAGGSDLPTFYFSSAVRYSFRGWQGYRASIISVSPHDFVPQPVEATACLSCRDWLCHRGVADGADCGDGIAGVPRAGFCAAGADHVAGGWLSGRAGAGVGV